MLDAYIYDGIRSPIGRHAGKLAPLRPDDLAGEMIAEVVRRNERQARGHQRRDPRLRDAGRRGLPQRGALRHADGRAAAHGAGRDGEPPVRFRPAGGHRCGARHHRGRRRALRRGRRGEHDARALRHGARAKRPTAAT